MKQSGEKNELLVHWFVLCAVSLALIIYNIVCHVFVEEIQIGWPENERVVIRSIFYIVAIILFPLTNLLKHVLIRLNQTMPGDRNASRRYLTTVVVSLAMIEMVPVFGIIMFVLGDDFNTLYIFSLLGALGVFLHRPKQEEYDSIERALRSKPPVE